MLQIIEDVQLAQHFQTCMIRCRNGSRNPKGKFQFVLTGENDSLQIFFPTALLSARFLILWCEFLDGYNVPVYLELFCGKTDFKQNSHFEYSIQVQAYHGQQGCVKNSRRAK